MRMGTSVVNTAGIKTGMATIRTPTGALRPQIVRTPITLRPGQTIATKTPFGTRPILATTQFSPSLVIKSGQPQQPVKEKRTFSSSGFVYVYSTLNWCFTLLLKILLLGFLFIPVLFFK